MKKSYQEFEDFVYDVLNEVTFQNIKRNVRVKGKEVDFEVSSDSEGQNLQIVEAKFYKSSNISSSLIYRACEQLAYLVSSSEGKYYGALLITSCILSGKIVDDIFQSTGVRVWDRKILYRVLRDKIQFVERLDEILLEENQIVDQAPFNSNSSSLGVSKLDFADVKDGKIIPSLEPNNPGEKIAQELIEVREGKSGWSDFEKKCLKALKFLFEDDLSVWKDQMITEDSINRYDLICRIASTNDFWLSLARYFNTRFVVFEFKNYKDPIKQGQVYTTEKYLFTKALRSVGIIIARNGADINAEKAMRISLREQGKLILMISLVELCTLLRMKDENMDPNDLLAEKLDKFLMELEK